MFRIKNRIISNNHRPFIIAELSGNHNGSLSNALKLVDIAAKCKVDAVKLQTFKADTITMKSNQKEFFIKDKKNIWRNQSLYKLYDKAHTPWEWHDKLFIHHQKDGSSVFNQSLVLNLTCAFKFMLCTNHSHKLDLFVFFLCNV